eukprot:8200754-Alexandrium_andersonii.AAC.1
MSVLVRAFVSVSISSPCSCRCPSVLACHSQVASVPGYQDARVATPWLTGLQCRSMDQRTWGVFHVS